MTGTSRELTALAGDLRTEIARLAWHLRKPAARSGITPTQLVALSALAKHSEGLRQGDLADLMSITAPTMSRLVELMSEPGWVTRNRDPDDHRALVLTLAKAGRAALDEARSESLAELGEVLAQLSEDEVQLLADALPALRRLGDLQMGEVSPAG